MKNLAAPEHWTVLQVKRQRSQKANSWIIPSGSVADVRSSMSQFDVFSKIPSWTYRCFINRKIHLFTNILASGQLNKVENGYTIGDNCYLYSSLYKFAFQNWPNYASTITKSQFSTTSNWNRTESPALGLHLTSTLLHHQTHFLFL